MGRSKDLFMADREADNFPVPYRQEKESLAAAFSAIQNTFLDYADEYEAGNIDALETAVLMRKSYERLEELMNIHKTWITENADAIETESEKHGNVYKGYKITKQTKTTYSFKNIADWQELDKQRKEFEAKSKAALALVQKGGMNVDENGEEIPLPDVSVTGFIKFDRVK